MKNLRPGTIVHSPLFPEPIEVFTTVTIGGLLKLIGKGLRSGRTYDPVINPTQLSQCTISPTKEAFDCSPARLQHRLEAVRTRYARVSDSDLWLEAPHKGFLGATIDSIEDRHDRIVLAWPSRPDNGFVVAALALREIRATSRRTHGTLAFWPWRSGATYSARSILVNSEDIWQTALQKTHSRSCNEEIQPTAKLAQDALWFVELRLKDLLPSRAEQANSLSEAPSSHHPTLLETTVVFEPTESQSTPAYVPNPDQILRRVRRYTTLAPEHVPAVGDPLITPFAIMGLNSTDRAALTRCLAYERFITHGLEAIIV